MFGIHDTFDICDEGKKFNYRAKVATKYQRRRSFHY